MQTTSPALNFILSKITKRKFDLKEVLEFQNGIDELEKLGALKLLALFQHRNIFTSIEEIHDLTEIQYRLNIIPKHKRILESLLELLIQHGYIRMLQPGIYELMTQSFPKAIQIDAAMRNLILKYPKISVNAHLLSEALNAYPNIISGKEDFLPILFPNGSFEIIENIYKLSPDATYFNQLTALGIKYYADYYRTNYSQRISIIELGAGIGSSTEHALPLLQETDTCYCYTYTDISNSFLKNAAKNFQHYSFLSYATLNIDQPLLKQAITQKYDIVVATNVLHAAKDILTTLKHVKDLLNPNGILILNDGVAKKDFSTLAYGLLDGWWAFEDTQWRISGSPFISLPHWQTLLKQSGFQQVVSLNNLLKPNIQIYQDVIIAALT